MNGGTEMDVREKLIEILRKPIFPHELVDPIEAVADYLLDSGVTVHGWISVDDGLPDACGFPCLLCGENSFGQIRVFEGFTGYMELGQFEWHSNQKDIDIDVWTIAHWMPLPQQPKGE